MICRIGKPLSVILRELHDKYGHCHMSEFNVSLAPEKKVELQSSSLKNMLCPNFPSRWITSLTRTAARSTLKMTDGLSAASPGTEPVIRIFCEQENEQKANEIIKVFRSFLGL